MWKVILELLFNIFTLLYNIAESVVKRFIPIQYRSKDICDQIALVTGSGEGLGRLLAIGLAKEGCKVVCWDTDKNANEETARLIKTDIQGAKVYTYQVDLSKKEEIYKAAENVKKDVGKVSILVNSASVVTGKNLLDCSDEQILNTFDINILSHFWTAKSFLPEMILQNSGHIVTVASLAGMNGFNRLVDYCASQYAAVGFDESLRIELAVDGNREGVKTTVVCPYFVNTPPFQGTESRVFPVLEPEQVANEIIVAILTEEPVCIIPKYQNYVMMLKNFLPTTAALVAYKNLGIAAALKNVQGTNNNRLEPSPKKQALESPRKKSSVSNIVNGINGGNVAHKET